MEFQSGTFLTGGDVGFSSGYNLSVSGLYVPAKYMKEEEIRTKKDGGINANRVARKILAEHTLIYSAGNFYQYDKGYYKRIEEEQIKGYIKNIIRDDFSKHRASEVLHSIQTEVFAEPDSLNDTEYLNLKNGLFDLESEMLYDHTPFAYSTIRLPVAFDKNAECKKWIKTVYEIFEGDENKIATLQEFCGLCLTKTTKYEKALFMIGDGANGKSTISYVVEHILGKENRSAIPLERLNSPHYTANLHNKLANISIETNTKSEVYDAVFKSVISGDSLEADPKYKQPFTFRPYCKLIFALNTMPRVNDRSKAFFRRLLILRFNKSFPDKVANKNLKYELLEELDGIFLWCIEGLRNLHKRGYFHIDKTMLAEIEEYRRENNSLLVFVDEECQLDPNASIAKQDLYDAYKRWCVNNGYRALSRRRFGKELMKQYRVVTEDRTSYERTWLGIR
ncbi:MAG: phage/plasmid primase, P4 family [Candidatus Omnitrophota bacterium]